MSRDRDDDRKAMLLLENAGSRAFVNAEIDVTLLREWNAINKNAGKGWKSCSDACQSTQD